MDKNKKNILLSVLLTLMILVLTTIISKNLNIFNKQINKETLNNAKIFIYDISEFQLDDNNIKEKIGYDFNTSYKDRQKAIKYKYDMENNNDYIKKIDPFLSTQFAFWKIDKLDIKRISKKQNSYVVNFNLTLDVNCYDFLPKGTGSETSYNVTNGKVNFDNLKIIMKEEYMGRDGNMIYSYYISEDTADKLKQFFLTWDGRNPYPIIDILKDKKVENRG